MTRYKAFTLHLVASALALAIIFLLIQQVWYPGKLFTLAAGFNLLCLIVGVDLVIGPLITLIIFNPKKKYLKFDMTIVILFQLGFMAYGCWTMFSARPVYYVFVDNRFYLVRANELDEKDIIKLAKNEQFRHLPLWGPKFVGTQEPTDLKLRNEIAMSSLFGMGLQNLPQYYVPYNQVTKQVLASAKTSEQLPVGMEAKNRLLAYEKNHVTESVLFLTVVNKNTPLIAMIDAKTAQVIALI